ncbi:MAG: hypothetical protein KJ072_07300 [Verrucomicrobia bacterium]|nr:hypothetical protein [Verrucomicrobiota bacterium]
MYQHVVGLHAIAKEEKKCRFAIEDVAPPSVDEGYGFFGLVTPCHSGLFLEFQPQFEVGMSFLREGESGRLAFGLGSPHKGHDAYRGCSGAPIVDSKGRLVSLVIGGCQATNEIFGVPLHTYRSSIVACAMADSAPSG